MSSCKLIFLKLTKNLISFMMSSSVNHRLGHIMDQLRDIERRRLTLECVVSVLTVAAITYFFHAHHLDDLVLRTVGFAAIVGLVVSGLFYCIQEHIFHTLRILFIPNASMLGVVFAIILAEI